MQQEQESNTAASDILRRWILEGRVVLDEDGNCQIVNNAGGQQRQED